MKTLIRHLACDEPIFVVDRKLELGDAIQASEWKPLNDAWPQPKDGDRCICPNCHQGFLPNDLNLQRVFVEDF